MNIMVVRQMHAGMYTNARITTAESGTSSEWLYNCKTKMKHDGLENCNRIDKYLHRYCQRTIIIILLKTRFQI